MCSSLHWINRRATFLIAIMSTVPLLADPLTMTTDANSRKTVFEGGVGHLFFTLTNTGTTDVIIDSIGFPNTVPSGIRYDSGDKTDKSQGGRILFIPRTLLVKSSILENLSNLDCTFLTSDPPNAWTMSIVGSGFIFERVDFHDVDTPKDKEYLIHADLATVKDRPLPEPSGLVLFLTAGFGLCMYRKNVPFV